MRNPNTQLNPLIRSIGALITLIDSTLSNARRFSSSMWNSTDIKGLKGKAAEEPYPGLFMFPLIQVKSTINKKSRARILTNYVRPNVSHLCREMHAMTKMADLAKELYN